MNAREQRLERTNLDCIVRRLNLDRHVDAAECAAIGGLWRSTEQHRAGETLRLATPRIITSGWAAWCRTSREDHRVIFLFLMPGDVLTPAIGSGDNGCDLVAMTRLCCVDARDLMDATTPVARAWIGAADRDYHARLLDHMSWLNDGSALRNLARLVLELHERASATGRCVNGRFEFPIGQRAMAQALGLSLVQVNKVMQQLRDAMLLSAERGWLRIDDAAALRDLADGTVKARGRAAHAVAARPCREALATE